MLSVRSNFKLLALYSQKYLSNEQTKTHRYRRQYGGYWREVGGGKGKLGGQIYGDRWRFGFG